MWACLSPRRGCWIISLCLSSIPLSSSASQLHHLGRFFKLPAIKLALIFRVAAARGTNASRPQTAGPLLHCVLHSTRSARRRECLSLVQFLFPIDLPPHSPPQVSWNPSGFIPSAHLLTQTTVTLYPPSFGLVWTYCLFCSNVLYIYIYIPRGVKGDISGMYGKLVYHYIETLLRTRHLPLIFNYLVLHVNTQFTFTSRTPSSSSRNVYLRNVQFYVLILPHPKLTN